MKKALVQSGGGVNGAFSAGVVEYLLKVLKEDYDIYSGVSVGAINSCLLVQYPYGHQNQAAEKLKEHWMNTKDSDVKKRWFPFGKIHALWEQAAFNSEPLWEMIFNHFDLEKAKSTKKVLLVGAVSLNSGQYKSFDLSHPQIIEAVIGSSAFPGMLLPVEIDGEFFVDGGIKNVSPLREAIDAGADHIDIINTLPRISPKSTNDFKNVLQIAPRALGLSNDEILKTDLEILEYVNKLVEAGKCKPHHRKITYRIIEPDNYPEHDGLTFDPKIIRKLYKEGYEKAQRIYGK